MRVFINLFNGFIAALPCLPSLITWVKVSAEDTEAGRGAALCRGTGLNQRRVPQGGGRRPLKQGQCRRPPRPVSWSVSAHGRARPRRRKPKRRSMAIWRVRVP